MGLVDELTVEKVMTEIDARLWVRADRAWILRSHRKYLAEPFRCDLEAVTVTCVSICCDPQLLAPVLICD